MTSIYDCDKLLVNFTTCPPDVRLVDHFPELKAFEEFTRQQDDNIIKIAILTSDDDSPFWKLRADRKIMVREIFTFLDIGTKNIIGQEFFQKVVEYKHEGISECWCAYLQLQYNIDFNDWAVSKKIYDMLMVELNSPKAQEEKSTDYANRIVKVRSQLRSIGEDLKSIESKVFKDSKMAQPVAMVERKKIVSYPEKFAVKDSIL